MTIVEFYWIWVFITLALHSSTSLAYGPEGHEIIARIADSMLSSKAKAKVYELIEDCQDNCLKNIAVWADMKGQKGPYRFTKTYHFYNGQDSPPTMCEEIEQMKCPESGCVIDAVSYYALVLANERLPREDRERALKYLVHLVGDIHQPLHLTKKLRGGTRARVRFGGNEDLHRVWDISMIKKRISETFKGDSEIYFHYLLDQLSNIWATEIADWRSCQYQVHPSSAKLGVCSTQWAYETSAWNCQGVWEKVHGGADLSSDYYQKFLDLDLPEKFMAKAGVRLAHVLENIFGDQKIPQGMNENGTVDPLEAKHLQLYQEEMAKRHKVAKELAKRIKHQELEEIPDIHESEEEEEGEDSLYRNRFDSLSDELDVQNKSVGESDKSQT